MTPPNCSFLLNELAASREAGVTEGRIGVQRIRRDRKSGVADEAHRYPDRGPPLMDAGRSYRVDG